MLFGGTTKLSKQYSDQVSVQYDTSSRDITYWNFMPSGMYSGGMEALQGGSGQDAGLSQALTTSQKDTNIPVWVYIIVAICVIGGFIYVAFRMLKGNKFKLKGKFV